MFQVINWLCYICVSLLVLEIMVYLCKDIIKVSKNNKKGKAKNIGNTGVTYPKVTYNNKIAK